MLDTQREIVRCLVTYADWWQPNSTSILKVSGKRIKRAGDLARPGLLESLDERSELCRRMAHLSLRDRELLVLWYVQQLPVEDISPIIRLSRRQCFRRRNEAIQTLIDLGEEAA